MISRRFKEKINTLDQVKISGKRNRLDDQNLSFLVRQKCPAYIE